MFLAKFVESPILTAVLAKTIELAKVEAPETERFAAVDFVTCKFAMVELPVTDNAVNVEFEELSGAVPFRKPPSMAVISPSGSLNIEAVMVWPAALAAGA